MISKIDWISFSVIMNPANISDERDCPRELVRNLCNLSPELADLLNLEDEFVAGNGRAPYRTSWQRQDHGLIVFTHPDLAHALVEISGRGCDRLASQGALESVLLAIQDRVTRIDVACDILTETRPTEFCEAGYSGKFKARSIVVSESGETYYVGAKTSNRYARVYRYNEPHERSAFLRVEYVIKAQDAKLLARTLSGENIRSVVASLGQAYGWCHPDWKIKDNPIELLAYRPDRKEGKTLFWLTDTIAPLLARLHSEGVLDVWEWIDKEVASRLRVKQSMKR